MTSTTTRDRPRASRCRDGGRRDDDEHHGRRRHEDDAEDGLTHELDARSKRRARDRRDDVDGVRGAGARSGTGAHETPRVSLSDLYRLVTDSNRTGGARPEASLLHQRDGVHRALVGGVLAAARLCAPSGATTCATPSSPPRTLWHGPHICRSRCTGLRRRRVSWAPRGVGCSGTEVCSRQTPSAHLLRQVQIRPTPSPICGSRMTRSLVVAPGAGPARAIAARLAAVPTDSTTRGTSVSTVRTDGQQQERQRSMKRFVSTMVAGFLGRPFCWASATRRDSSAAPPCSRRPSRASQSRSRRAA